MTEDERQNLLGTLAEAHAGLSEVAFKLRRELTPKTSVLKAAIKAERETFRLKRELQRLDIENPEQAKGRESLPAFVREPEGMGLITSAQLDPISARVERVIGRASGGAGGPGPLCEVIELRPNHRILGCEPGTLASAAPPAPRPCVRMRGFIAGC